MSRNRVASHRHRAGLLFVDGFECRISTDGDESRRHNISWKHTGAQMTRDESHWAHTDGGHGSMRTTVKHTVRCYNAANPRLRPRPFRSMDELKAKRGHHWCAHSLFLCLANSLSLFYVFARLRLRALDPCGHCADRPPAVSRSKMSPSRCGPNACSSGFSSRNHVRKCLKKLHTGLSPSLR